MSGLVMLLTALLGAEGSSRPVDFDTEVVPVLTRAGCNAGSCHGAAVGRGGFKLALLGGDPALDYESIVHELEGRRINLARPDASLLLRKPTGKLDHEGGVRLATNGRSAERVRAWIASGAPRLQTRSLVRFEVEPVYQVVEAPGAEITLRATAHFGDGVVEDVTRWTLFTANDPASVVVDKSSAKATIQRRGQHIVIARYLDRVVPVQLIVPMTDQSIDLSAEPRRNFIDEDVLATLAVVRLPASPLADDATFLRRATLDLTGRLPTIDEARAFLAAAEPDKRKRLVDGLVASDAFTAYWTFRFATLFRIRSQVNEPEAGLAFHSWLRAQIERGTPFDVVARALLTAEGDSHQIGPANFHRVAPDARAQAEYVAQVFMGVRLQCANCHNHPLDRWTQDDYHGLAAVFARVERGRHVRLIARGDVTHPRTGEPAAPKVPGGRFLDQDRDARQDLAKWLTDRDNRYFSRAVVNRLWKALMGRGLVEPVDDLRDTNPATHPELLERLAADFVAHGYDIRQTLSLIATSAAYGRSAAATPANRGDDRFYSHALVRSLEPEVLADALADVTGVDDRYGDLPEGTRAVTLVDPSIPSESLDILGRCTRQVSCEAAAGTGGGLPAKLHLLNGPLINRKVTAPEGRLKRLMNAGGTDDQVLTEFTLRSLSRFPTEQEQVSWLRRLSRAETPAERAQLLEDIVWGLLNCREFVTNH